MVTMSIAGREGLAAMFSGQDPREPPPVPRPGNFIKRYPKSWKLNRSNRWPYASTYADARAQSPYPDRPVW